ncbi:hypothetical protein QBC36DRAFT_198954 [Triangularia setosa]|uniref:Uncharacterized protein n=1 Tax=Triangularia setosa TaxID=2587417 RepID=A0AAN6VYL0_9PEZI|nr:hypothetical protein QBC36DRAFT_198954 [Podospora setosa]
MHPVDLGDPVVPEHVDDDYEDDMEEIPMLTMRDRITAACVEGGITRFSLLASRKLRRVKNAFLYSRPSIDDSWEYLTAEEQEEACTEGKEQKKFRDSVYHSFVSSAWSGNAKPHRARTDAIVSGQEAGVHHAEHRTARKEMAMTLQHPMEPPKEKEPPKQPAGFEIAPLARQAGPKSADSNIIKPVIQPVDKFTDKRLTTTDKFAVEKPIEKAVEKPIEKAVEKPIEKAVEKPIEKATEKPTQPAVAPVKQKGKQRKKSRKYQDEDWLEDTQAFQQASSFGGPSPAGNKLDELPYVKE